MGAALMGKGSRKSARGRSSRSRTAAHSARVALVSTLVVAVCYGIVVGSLDLLVRHRMTGTVDARIRSTLLSAASSPEGSPLHMDGDDVPVFVWRLSSDSGARNGEPVALVSNSPPLSAGLTATIEKASRDGWSAGQIGNQSFRFISMKKGRFIFVGGESLAELSHTTRDLLASELLVAPLILVFTYLGSLLIGLKASEPIEGARVRQLEFTADASHELRTPLSVIEAEVSLALSRQRDAASYKESLERIEGESLRLRKIVDSLLWLARFDSGLPPPMSEPIELATIAESCADRFATVAASKSLELVVTDSSSAGSLVLAPADWIDRLCGVLVDNACRYAPESGRVEILVFAGQGKAGISVEDSGPGIPQDAVGRIFDRFHRNSDVPGGTGLGLAIADSIVESTGGMWEIGRSRLGGAKMAVSWKCVSENGRDST